MAETVMIPSGATLVMMSSTAPTVMTNFKVTQLMGALVRTMRVPYPA
jgi:hypothetical protein